jgi:hypothetical protein
MNTEKITTDQAEAIKHKLGKLNLWRKKKDVVKDFSLKNSEHMYELTTLEAHKLIEYLDKLIPQADGQRKRMLSLGYQLHWDRPRTPAEHAMEPKRINYNHVSDWLLKDARSKFKKPLHHLDPFELTDAVQQLEQVLNATKEQMKKAHA